MPALLMIAGLVLLIALPHLFVGAATVGVILLVSGAIWLLFSVLAFRKVRKMQKSMFGGRDPFDLNDFRRH